MFDDQTLLLSLHDTRSQIDIVTDHALAMLNRLARHQKAVHSAEFIEDKVDALADLIAISTAFNALGIAIETSSAEIAQVARGLARC